MCTCVTVFQPVSQPLSQSASQQLSHSAKQSAGVVSECTIRARTPARIGGVRIGKRVKRVEYVRMRLWHSVMLFSTVYGLFQFNAV